MTDEEIDDLYQKALATTARDVERPAGAEPFSPSEPAWCYADAFIDLIERVLNAERKGAEEMRETAAKRLEWRGAECWVGDSTTATTMRRVYAEEAEEIRRLPLPGDAP